MFEEPLIGGKTVLALRKNFHYKTPEGVAQFTQRLSLQLLLEQVCLISVIYMREQVHSFSLCRTEGA